MSDKKGNDKKVNPNGVYFAHDKLADRSQEDFIKDLTFNVDDIIHIREIKRTADTGKDKTYIICMKKDQYELDKDKLLKEKSIVVKQFFNAINKKLPPGFINGFYVNYQTEEKSAPKDTYKKFCAGLTSIFKRLSDGDFIEEDSYEIIFPPSYPDGKIRQFAIVNFKGKNKNRYITPFVNKLKYMIDDYELDNISYRIKWLSQKVFNDIQKGENKEIKQKEAKSTEKASA